MSSLFRSPPSAFEKHDDFELFDVHKTASVDGVLAEPELRHKSSAARKTPPILLRDDHIVLLAIDAVLALHASFKKWRNHRRTLRALAELDERQLRDIGLTRDGILFMTPVELLGPKSYRALAEFDVQPLDGETK
jgi:hypothetical protein